MHFALGVVLDRNAALLRSGNWRKQIKHELIVDFKVAHSNCIFLLKSSTYFLEDLVDRSGDNTSVLVVLGTPTHRECLSSPCLSVDKDCAVEALNHRFDYVSGAPVENFLLGGVVQNLVELETPLFCLIVNKTASFILWHLHSNSL